jgi:hypothetical protein
MKEEKKIEKANRRAMRQALQKLIAGGLQAKGKAGRVQAKAMAKQMAQGKHPEMGV